MIRTVDTSRRLGGTYGSLLDFWGWAFSDLKMNNVRGVFAEWIVAQILELEPRSRSSWDNFDLQLPSGETIEVKSGAYVQAWRSKNDNLSKIVFSGLRSRFWNEHNHAYSKSTSFNADIYVFCVQIETNKDRWDALDLSQWEFYVLLRSDMENHGTKTIALSVVKKLARGRVFKAAELKRAIDELWVLQGATPTAPQTS
jgi:hypothetical protein